MNFQLVRLKTLDLKAEKYFKVYRDSDVIPNLSSFNKNGKEVLIDSAQDDDVESDDEVVNSGIQTSFKDLLVVKDYLRHNPERVRAALRTFKTWAPLFGGRMPYAPRTNERNHSQTAATSNSGHHRLQPGQSAASNAAASGHDRSRSHLNFQRGANKGSTNNHHHYRHH